jgi:hypothetical protein
MKLQVIRGNHMAKPAALEPGVKFFVLMLEQLGCVTHFSCEGHPHHFYIIFSGPLRTAQRIADVGFLDVRLWRRRLLLRILRQHTPRNLFSLERDHASNSDKAEVLSDAAIAWTKAFGDCRALSRRASSKQAQQA